MNLRFSSGMGKLHPKVQYIHSIYFVWSSHLNSHLIHCPKMRLPKYSGELFSWLSGWLVIFFELAEPVYPMKKWWHVFVAWIIQILLTDKYLWYDLFRLYMYYIDMYIISVLDSFWLCIISRSCQGAGGGWDSDDEVRISQVFFFFLRRFFW